MSRDRGRRIAAAHAPIVGRRRSGGGHGCGHRDGRRHRVRGSRAIMSTEIVFHASRERCGGHLRRRRCRHGRGVTRTAHDQNDQRGDKAHREEQRLCDGLFAFTYRLLFPEIAAGRSRKTLLHNLPPLRVPSV